MTSPPRPFLTAEWRHLAMLNYDVDPAILQPFVPHGVELDDWQGHTFVSMVGFLFLDTRVMGVPIPFHRNFEEVNLRSYVRRRAPEGWRRGVVFIKEIVPRAAIAFTARALYGENYATLPMRYHFDPSSFPSGSRRVSYYWQLQGRENVLGLSVRGDPAEPAPGSDAEFITEHYWGYGRRRHERTTEYRVDHPRWRVSAGSEPRLDCDIGELYGREFVEPLTARPASAFLAEGSRIVVSRGQSLGPDP
jgi:uncharacterized protein YqjF (DUF2071 family)